VSIEGNAAMVAAGIQQRVPASADDVLRLRGAGRRGGAAIRVLVGEDNYLARVGIEGILEDMDGVCRVGTCVDLDRLREAVFESDPDLVLTEVRMPPTYTDEGLRLAGELRESHPAVGVIILSQYAEPEYATALFVGGADRRGYLLKERLSDPDELRMALRRVAGGGAYVDPGLIAPLLAEPSTSESGLASLTQRELQILALVANGRSNAAVAAVARVGTRAVERHIYSIFSKLGLHHDTTSNRRVRATRLYLAADDEA
jgi:DNA-binding NarL/FixJ family response regulator